MDLGGLQICYRQAVDWMWYTLLEETKRWQDC